MIAPISPPRVKSDRVLTIQELRELWSALEYLDSPGGAILRVYLLTGGQRLAQLLRARRDNRVAGSVMLYDRKGRRTTARPHLIPIIGAARHALTAISSEGPYLLVLKPGEMPPHPATLFRHLQSVTGRLVSEGVTQENINFAVLRRTIETQLATAGVPSLVRAHLQSHSLDGVQTRHYDRHSNLEEKRAALETLLNLIAD